MLFISLIYSLEPDRLFTRFQNQVNTKLEQEYRRDLSIIFNCAKEAYKTRKTKQTLFFVKSEVGFSAKVFDLDDTLVIAFKGTSPDIPGLISTEQTVQDRKTDNMLFSTEISKGDMLKVDDLIAQAEKLVNEAKKYYSNKNILLTGHSFGGAIASLVGNRTETPAIAFSAPGEKFISDKLDIHRKTESKVTSTIHIGTCNDSIYTGKCNTNRSLCKLLDYRLNTRCHLGVKYCIESPGPLGILFHTCGVLHKMIEHGVNYRALNDKFCQTKSLIR